MLLSELLGRAVVDAEGVSLGRVRDVRLVQDRDRIGMAEAGLRVQGLVVGPNGIADRLGYDRRGVRGPWLVAKVATWLHRHNRFVPWEQVSVAGTTVHLACGRAELAPPVPIPVREPS
jgi:sporulation protein YlmC with PRC-barrel domain